METSVSASPNIFSLDLSSLWFSNQLVLTKRKERDSQVVLHTTTTFYCGFSTATTIISKRYEFPMKIAVTSVVSRVRSEIVVRVGCTLYAL